MMQNNPAFFVKTQDGKIARGFWPQPLPDYHNPQVRKYLIDSLVHWVRDFGVDGFRCDVGRVYRYRSGMRLGKHSTMWIQKLFCYRNRTVRTIS